MNCQLDNDAISAASIPWREEGDSDLPPLYPGDSAEVRSYLCLRPMVMFSGISMDCRTFQASRSSCHAAGVLEMRKAFSSLTILVTSNECRYAAIPVTVGANVLFSGSDALRLQTGRLFNRREMMARASSASSRLRYRAERGGQSRTLPRMAALSAVGLSL